MVAFVSTALFILINWTIVFTLKQHCDRVDTKTLTCNYIPKDIPIEISSIHILDFKEKYEVFEVNSSHFNSDNWRRVKSLVLKYDVYESTVSILLKSKCFHGLKTLQELHIHLLAGIKLDPNAFTGLDTPKLLDMSRCIMLNLTALEQSLDGNGKFPRLENLKVSELNIYGEPNKIDTKFAKALKDKNITALDFSNTKISKINITAVLKFMNGLKNVNLSSSTISHVSIDKNIDVRTLEHMHVLDASHIHIFWIVPSLKIFNRTWYLTDLPYNWNYVFYPRIVNFSACIPDSGHIWIMNSTVKVNEPFPWKSQEVIFRQNNIKHLDLNMQCSKYTVFTVIHADVAQNGLEFLHPSILSCFPNLKTLDLSSNELYKMVQEHLQLFEQLPFSLSHLKLINLSNNFLKSIPEDIFIQNYDLEMIDLSHNDLEQVTFNLHHLEKLKLLDLQHNRIKILNGISINNLNSINTTGDMKATVQLASNPVSCSECQAKMFLQWLTSTNSVNIPKSDLRCITENGSEQKIDHRTLETVQDICNRKTIIISVSTSVGLTALVAVVTVTILYKHRNWATKKANRINFLNKLQEGRGQHEFVAFLSYSSEDKDFVDNSLIEKLNENLQLTTGMDRNLVCTGDLYLRPGFLILDETARCIERASAFIMVVSDSYCTSAYCHNEVDLACRLNKPIILMIKGHVDENLMMPTMKMLFKSNVRVLWTLENNDYILKTTWENVCTSLLDLITQNQNWD